MRKIIPVLCVVGLLAACSLAAQQPISIRFRAVMGKSVVIPDQSYVNILGDTLSITRFRFYVSHLVFIKKDGTVYQPSNEYYLIDALDSNSAGIRIHIPDPAIREVQFLLGVDSLHNVSGIQAGALDPANGMFWTWNSGYIMAKLEGNSPHLPVPGHRFSYHIGGFAGKWNVLKTIRINLPENTGTLHAIDLNADLNCWFKGPTVFRLQNLAFCHSPGPLALQFADNYAAMFSLKSIE
ncbi:MAG TPA: MbnP family protein [Sediminibacterium sp.]|nr:MbnP family protein [Sediminibacterium sp.]